MAESAFRPEMADQAHKLCLLGATDDELAEFFGINSATIYRWRKAHPDFADACRAGKREADSEVASSLFKRARGYSYNAEKVVTDRVTKITAAVPYEAHMPPDTLACIFWLKNRQPDKWHDVRQTEIGRPGDFSTLSDAELRAKLAEEAAALGYGEMADSLRKGVKMIDVTPEIIEAAVEE